MQHPVVSQQEWLRAREALLEKEKAFDRQRDALNEELRQLPWVRVEKDYLFDTAEGQRSLADLFGEKSQLVVQHFMFGADWEAGCPSCSFWVDGFDPMVAHLGSRDVAYVAISRAPLESLEAYRKRMGWDILWASSLGNSFNFDFNVSATPEELEAGEMTYNFRRGPARMAELPGMSVFHKNAEGEIFRTYSTFARGLDRLNAAYHVLDIVPKGRDEQDLPHPQAWVKRHDEYEG